MGIQINKINSISEIPADALAVVLVVLDSCDNCKPFIAGLLERFSIGTSVSIPIFLITATMENSDWFITRGIDSVPALMVLLDGGSISVSTTEDSAVAEIMKAEETWKQSAKA